MAEVADLVARQAEAREREARRAAFRAEVEAQALVERERAVAEAAARQVPACADYGRARPAGLCEACGHRRQTRALIAEASLLASTWPADPTAPNAVAAVATGVRTAIEGEITFGWEQFQRLTVRADPKKTDPDYLPAA